MTAAEWAEAIATEAREAIGTRGGGGAVDRVWRPGDLAMVRWTDSGSESVAIVESVISPTLLSVWTYTGDVRGPLAFHPRDLRPVVAVEPDHAARLAQLTADLAAARSALAACRQVAHERAEAGRGES